jgi:2-oxo-4-hydroxy-4-carboxy-5-ureidoimidazoline decarboxylase
MNREYVNKHGFIFIICASGLSAEAMLNELEIRLPNSTNTEIEKAAQEQIKITLLRIKKAFDGAIA